MTDFGFFLSGEECGPRQLVQYGQAAEAAGLDRVWISDHFHPWMEVQGHSPFVWTVLGGLAATTNLQLTTAVTCPTFRIHPAILAQATATTAAMAPGRFRFGIGSGEALNEHVLGDAWPPVSVRLARLEEAVDVIRQLWTGKTVTHEGRYFTVHDARIFTLPPEPPEILISGFGPEATELAARIGDGWITTSPDAEGMELFRSRNKGTTQAGVKICWAATEEEAKQTAYRYWGHQGMGGQASQDLPMWQEFEAMAEQNSPDKVAEHVACGPDPHRAADELRPYLEVGFDELYVSQMGPDQLGGIRFLCDEVFPLLT